MFRNVMINIFLMVFLTLKKILNLTWIQNNSHGFEFHIMELTLTKTFKVFFSMSIVIHDGPMSYYWVNWLYTFIIFALNFIQVFNFSIIERTIYYYKYDLLDHWNVFKLEMIRVLYQYVGSVWWLFLTIMIFAIRCVLDSILFQYFSGEDNIRRHRWDYYWLETSLEM